jgi:DNA-binding NarL/FixJ family response regulator
LLPLEQQTIRIVIADDHPLFRGALTQMLSGQRRPRIVGEAADGLEALESCRQLRPDLILMDVNMPRMDGLEATRSIKEAFPQTIVLILTAFADPNYLTEALRAGASGYILKTASAEEVLHAIHEVLSGESRMDHEVAMSLLRLMLDETPQQRRMSTYAPGRPVEESLLLLEKLSQRELDVLRLVVKGRTNREIAKDLLVSTSTVKKNIHQICSKLGVSDRIQAAVRAVELGLRPEHDG